MNFHIKYALVLFFILLSNVMLSAQAPKHVGFLSRDTARIFKKFCNGKSDKNCKRVRDAFDAYKKVGKAYQANNDFSQIPKMEKIAQTYLDLGETTVYIYIMKTASALYCLDSQWEKAGEIAYKILKVSEATNDSIGIAKFHFLMGMIYGNKRQTLESEKHYRTADHLFKTISKEKMEWMDAELAIFAQNYGNILFDQKKYAEAKTNYESALRYFLSINNTNNLIITYATLGRTEIALGESDSAQVHLELANQLSMNNGEADAAVLNSLAELYFKKGAYEKALKTARRSYERCIEVKDKEFSEHALLLMAESYGKLNRYKEAYEVQQELNKVRETMNALRKDSNMADLENVYQLEKKQLENKILENNLLANKKTNRLYLLILAGSALGLIGLGFLYIKNRRQRNKLEQLDGLNKQIFSILSHDLRAPISSLKASLQILNEEEDAEKFREKHLPKITQKLNTVSGLLDTLLKWSRSQLNEQASTPETINLESLVQEALKVAEVQASPKNIQLTFDAPDDLFVVADKDLLMTLLRNLLDNAVKFTPQNGSVSVKVSERNEQASISVIDSGTGISPTIRQKLLSGQSVSESGSQGEKGIGLGWQLINNYIKAMKGTVEITNNQDKGSNVTFYIPMI